MAPSAPGEQVERSCLTICLMHKKPYTDPIVYESGFFKDKAHEERFLGKFLSASQPVEQVQSYIHQARTLLAERAMSEGMYYTDRRHVRQAGRLAWRGVLAALSRWVKAGASLENYRHAVRLRDPKALVMFNNAHDTLNQVLGTDGNLNVGIVEAGILEAEAVISWTEQFTGQVP